MDDQNLLAIVIRSGSHGSPAPADFSYQALILLQLLIKVQRGATDHVQKVRESISPNCR